MSRISDVKQKIFELTAELKLYDLETKRLSTENSRVEEPGTW